MLVKSAVKETQPAPGTGIRLAVYQGEAAVGSKEAVAANIARADAVAAKAAQLGAQLLSFPELYLSGYALNRTLVPLLAEPYAPTPGPSLQACAQIAARHNIALVMPYPEHDAGTGRYYDSICIISPTGFLGNYRKTHLFGNSEREIFSQGDGPFLVTSAVNGFPVGVLNCYEAEFPELSRVLAILGAKLIVIPTAADTVYTLSSGETTTCPYPDVSHTSVPVRAFEDNVFAVYSNRMGREVVNGHEWTYQGNSIICGPDGSTIVEAPHTRETLLVADIVPTDFGDTHPEHTDFLRDLRPELVRPYYDMLAARKEQH